MAGELLGEQRRMCPNIRASVIRLEPLSPTGKQIKSKRVWPLTSRSQEGERGRCCRRKGSATALPKFWDGERKRVVYFGI